MTPYHQLILHDPEHGHYGDCLRTVIGCLLDIDPVNVPHFNDGTHTDDQWEAADEWLEPRGLRTFIIAFTGDRADVLNTMAANNPGVFYLLVGKSYNGVGHVVVCQDDRIVHDPSWTNCSVVAPDDNGIWCVVVLIAASQYGTRMEAFS